MFWPWLSAYSCLRGLRPAKKQTSTNHGKPIGFCGSQDIGAFLADTAKGNKFTAPACGKIARTTCRKLKHARLRKRVQQSSFWEGKCGPKWTPEASFWLPAPPWPGKRQPEGPEAQKEQAETSPRAGQEREEEIFGQYGGPQEGSFGRDKIHICGSVRLMGGFGSPDFRFSISNFL